MRRLLISYHLNMSGEGSKVKSDTTHSTVDDCADQLQRGYSKIDYKSINLVSFSDRALSNSPLYYYVNNSNSYLS